MEDIIIQKIKRLKNEIKYEKRKIKCCAYGDSDLMYLYGLEEELKDLENQLGKGETIMKREITDEMIKKLLDVFESNKDSLYELDSIIDEDGVLDNGITDIHDTFEMGYNNALEYVFGVLGIKY